MLRTLLILFVVATLVACNQTENPVQSTDTTRATSEGFSYATFGTAFTEEGVLTTNQLQELVQGKDSLQAVVTAEIVECCQSKGCWMDVKLADNSTMKVTFRDYGFFMPVEDLKGRTVVFTGTAKREVTTVDDQRHYAKDAGKTDAEIAAITTPKEELKFVADGVILK